MTTIWRCLDCPATGTGDRDAEKHVKATGHSVCTWLEEEEQ